MKENGAGESGSLTSNHTIDTKLQSLKYYGTGTEKTEIQINENRIEFRDKPKHLSLPNDIGGKNLQKTASSVSATGKTMKSYM